MARASQAAAGWHAAFIVASLHSWHRIAYHKPSQFFGGEYVS